MKSFRNLILTYSRREYYANLWRLICHSSLSNTFTGTWNAHSTCQYRVVDGKFGLIVPLCKIGQGDKNYQFMVERLPSVQYGEFNLFFLENCECLYAVFHSNSYYAFYIDQLFSLLKRMGIYEDLLQPYTSQLDKITNKREWLMKFLHFLGDAGFFIDFSSSIKYCN